MDELSILTLENLIKDPNVLLLFILCHQNYLKRAWTLSLRAKRSSFLNVGVNDDGKEETGDKIIFLISSILIIWALLYLELT